MKLTYLTSLSLPSEWAHSIQIVKMCEAFAETGAELTLFFPKRAVAVSEDMYQYHEVEKNFSIKPIRPLDFLPTNPGKIWYYVRTLSFLLQAWPWIFFNKNPVYIREPILGFFLRNFFLEIHSVPEKPNYLWRSVFRRARGIVTITTPLKNMIESFGVDKNRILVAPSAVDVQAFDLKMSKQEVRNILQLPTEKTIIAYLGGFAAVGLPKGIDTLIQMIEILPENYLLLLVGGDPDGVEKFKQYAATKNILHKIIFTGQVPHPAIPRYMQAADILIAAYPPFDFYKYHTSPLKIFEYMAAGRPIVTTDFPTLRDILDDSSAILVKSGDVAAYAAAVTKITENPVLAQSLVASAQAKIKENTWKKRAEKISQFIANNSMK